MRTFPHDTHYKQVSARNYSLVLVTNCPCSPSTLYFTLLLLLFQNILRERTRTSLYLFVTVRFERAKKGLHKFELISAQHRWFLSMSYYLSDGARNRSSAADKPSQYRDTFVFVWRVIFSLLVCNCFIGLRCIIRLQ